MGAWYRILLSLVPQSPGSTLIEFSVGAIPVSPSKTRSLLPFLAHTKVRNLDKAEPAMKRDAGQGGSHQGSFTGKSPVLRDALSHQWYSPSSGPQPMGISRVEKKQP